MCSNPFAEKLKFKTKSFLPIIIKLRQTSKAINMKMSSRDVHVCTEQSEACLYFQSKEANKGTLCQVEAMTSTLRLGCLLIVPHTNEAVKECIKYE
jgi:hypothetical protein